MSTGGRIKEMRKELGITLSELSRRTGISKGYLSSLEADNAPRPSADTLFKIARTLGTTVADLLGEQVNRADVTIPDSLRRFAEKEKLTETDMTMLAGIVYRGQHPETEEDWRFIFESIRRTLRSGERKA